MRIVPTVLALWLCAAHQSLAVPEPVFKTVYTNDGPIIGHHAPNESAVWEFLGIPYAQPPTGPLRFAAPQRYKASHRIHNATSFGFDCPQQAAAQPAFPGLTPQALRILAHFTAAAGTQRSDNCLTLNIWSKALPTNAAGKPVLVLFHGGRFAGSNTNSPFANGQHLANAEDLLVASVNYRLNAFGFPGAPGADTNLGLRDQRLAVEWLKDNVAAFGGDPRRIVIAGQSSGGAAVDWWSYAYKQDPIVQGLISTSGNTFSFPMNTPQKQRDNWLALATALGCRSTNDTLTCMRSGNITSQAITAAVAKIAPSPGGSPVRSTPPFYPMVDNQTIFGDYLSLSSAGDFARLPYLQGHNDYEQGYYIIPAFAQGRNVTAAQTAQFLLESFVCPISYETNQRSKAGVPTWVYRYFGDWENTRLYPTSGAYHGTELHMILGSSEDASGILATQVQKDTAKLFQRAVAAFVADPKGGLLNVGWPQFDPVQKSWIEIALGNRPAITFADPAKYDGTCPSVVMGALSTV